MSFSAAKPKTGLHQLDFDKFVEVLTEIAMMGVDGGPSYALPMLIKAHLVPLDA